MLHIFHFVIRMSCKVEEAIWMFLKQWGFTLQSTVLEKHQGSIFHQSTKFYQTLLSCIDFTYFLVVGLFFQREKIMIKQEFNKILQSKMSENICIACFLPTRMILPYSVEVIPCICTFGHFQHPLGPKISCIGGILLNIHVCFGDVFIWISDLKFLHSQS